MAIDGGSVEIRFEGNTEPLRRALNEAGEYVDQFGEKWELIEREVANGSTFEHWEKDTRSSFQKFADSATDVFTQVIDSSDSVISSIKGIGSALTSIGTGAAIAGLAVGTKSLINMAKGAVNETSALEKVQIQMIGLTHSVEKGNRAMAMAVKYFKNNPFNRFEVTNATKSLVQFGAKLDEIPSLLDKLGKVALSTGASLDTMAYYYQRNISDGRIATRDLIQMQNQGIPIFQALAKQVGSTAGAVREMAAKGKISVEDFQAAFDSLVDDQAMERFNNTLARQIDRFKGRMSNMKAALAGYSTSETGGLEISAQGLYRAVTKFIKTFADIMDSDTGKKIYEGFEKIGNAIGRVIDSITKMMKPAMEVFGNFLNFLGDNSAMLIPLLGGLAVALTNVASAIPGIGGIITQVKAPFVALITNIRNLIKLSPGLTAFLALLIYGFKEAYQNDEAFRKTIQELAQSLRDIISVLAEAGKGAFQAFVEVIKELANSGVIKGILQGIASSLKVMAQAIASIPPEILAGLMSFILSLRLLNASPISYAIMLIGMFVSYVKEMGDLPTALSTIGHNMMTGLVNGLKEGAQKVFAFIKNVVSTILSTFKNMLGIHSPSTVMYGIGENIGLGLAEGITDSESAVQTAMNNLASDVLKLASKIIGNKMSFGLIDYNGQYKEWKRVSQLFVEGSEQYNEAIENMEEARKNANLKILDLQKSYNDELDNTIKKISSMYGLFSDVNLGGGKNSSQILKGLDQQVAKMQEWAEAQDIINNLGLDPKLVEELQEMGVDSVSELSAIASMTADELSTLNELWLEKQRIANDAGIKQMEGLKNDTLDQIEKLKDGIDGATVDIADVGGRLVENIAEGVYGAMPTLDEAFSKLGDYIEKAKRAMGGGGAGDVTGAGDVEDEGDNLIAGVKEEITASMDKLKSMLPNILLGAIGAWGAFKFGPKILKAIGNKLFSKGGNVAESLSGTLFRLAEGGKLGKLDLEGLVDALFANSTEGSNSQKIISKVQDKLRGLSSDGAIQEAAKSASRVSRPAESIAQSSTSISQSVSTTGQNFSKASGWMNSIQQGAKTIIYIAGAIAAVAGALWITYNALKDVDFKKLTGQLAMMGLAVAEFGVLATLADKLKISAKGILTIAGLAADIGVVALACRVAYELMKGIDFIGFQLVLVEMAEALVVMGALATAAGAVMEATVGTMALGMLTVIGLAGDIALSAVAIRAAYDAMAPIDFEKFQYVVLEMIEALGVMGGFSALFGLLMPLVGLGWVSILAICDELVKVSNALVVVDRNVPEDFGSLETKLKNIKKTLEIVNGLDLGTVIGMMVTSWSAEPVERIMTMYLRVAETLNKISKIDLDKDAIEASLDYIKATLDTIDAKTDVISGWLEASALDMEASTVENAGRIVIVYGNMVDALNKLANFSPDEEAISASLASMVGVITLLRNSSYGGGGLFNIFNNMDTVANDVEKIKDIVKNYLEMVPTMKSLGEPENKISSSLKKTVETNIENIKDIVLTIGSVDTGGWIDQKENDIGKIQSILNKFTELIPVINQISTMNISKGDENSGAIKRIKDIKTIVKEIGSVDTGGWIDQKESDMGKIQSILNKFTELAQTTNHFGREGYQVAEGAVEYIQKVRHMVWEIGQINTGGSDQLPTKEGMVNSAISIAGKFKELQNTLKELDTTDYTGLVTNMVSTINNLLTGVAGSVSGQLESFQNLGVQISQKLGEGMGSQADALKQAGAGMQSSIWAGVNDKINDEYWQGVELANKFGEGVKSVSFENIGAQMQGSLWLAIQNRMQDEYYQGRAMGERFRQGLYDVDYANSGWWAVQGFINGVNNRGYYSGSDGVWNVGYNLANTFLNGLKTRAGQGSPWKTTIESGNWAVEGLIEGMKESEDDLVMEAENIADKLVDALTMDDLTVSPTLDPTLGNVTPSMASGEYGMIGGNNSSVVINQQNTAYTEYDIDKVNRDLAWQLSTI